MSSEIHDFLAVCSKMGQIETSLKVVLASQNVFEQFPDRSGRISTGFLVEIRLFIKSMGPLFCDIDLSNKLLELNMLSVPGNFFSEQSKHPMSILHPR